MRSASMENWLKARHREETETHRANILDNALVEVCRCKELHAALTIAANGLDEAWNYADERRENYREMFGED